MYHEQKMFDKVLVHKLLSLDLSQTTEHFPKLI